MRTVSADSPAPCSVSSQRHEARRVFATDAWIAGLAFGDGGDQEPAAHLPATDRSCGERAATGQLSGAPLLIQSRNRSIWLADSAGAPLGIRLPE